MSITKTEREELRRIVRQQFKVLRNELAQRKAEMYAEAERTILERFQGLDEARAHAEDLARDIIDEANRRLRDLGRESDEACGGIRGYAQITSGYRGVFTYSPDRRMELHNAAVRKIDADVKAAGLRLDRDEADLLKRLSIGALESTEAQKFLEGIPSVGELVPVARMAELEAALAHEPLIDDELDGRLRRPDDGQFGVIGDDE